MVYRSEISNTLGNAVLETVRCCDITRSEAASEHPTSVSFGLFSTGTYWGPFSLSLVVKKKHRCRLPLGRKCQPAKTEAADA